MTYRVTFYDDETEDTREIVVQNTGIIPAIEDAVHKLMNFNYHVVRAEEVAYSESTAQKKLLSSIKEKHDAGNLLQLLYCDDMND